LKKKSKRKIAGERKKERKNLNTLKESFKPLPPLFSALFKKSSKYLSTSQFLITHSSRHHVQKPKISKSRIKIIYSLNNNGSRPLPNSV